MPVSVSYPGVYVEEIPSGVRTITGVSTSNTAFIDYFKRGPVNKATRITSYGDFERAFGGLDSKSEASYAIQQYYQNGGSIAWVVRVTSDAADAEKVIDSHLKATAKGAGTWGDNLSVVITKVKDEIFNMDVKETVKVDGKDLTVNTESYMNLVMDSDGGRYAVDVVNAQSSLIKLTRESDANDDSAPAADTYKLEGGDDGDLPDTTAKLLGAEADKSGMYALDDIAPEIFNIMCLPAIAGAGFNSGNYEGAYTAATSYCESKRAFLIVDPQTTANKDNVATAVENFRHKNSAVYFPRVTVSDALNEGRARNIGASGTMAGVFARTDSTRGIWKAPAGTDASLRGAKIAQQLTDLQNGALNPLGINVLRSFPIFGNISWGGRTLDGADQKASEWKYIPVRRTALYIEESLFQGLKWVVFEPNDEPLWAQIRLNVGAFMHNMFRQAAFQGSSPKEAYFVKCDSETTTQNDINLGIVNVVVGFAPLKPAEFVVIKLQQIAGQVEA